MKTIPLSLLSLLVLLSCSKKEDNATVIKDCTGAYIRIDSKDYFICNDEMVVNFENETKVYVEYDKVEQCDQTDDVICLMLHLSEDKIELTKIK